MPDEFFRNIAHGRLERYRDMGDGSVAKVVALALDAAGSGSPAVGSPTDGPWDGSASSATMISILKGVYLQLAAINANTGT